MRWTMLLPIFPRPMNPSCIRSLLSAGGARTILPCLAHRRLGSPALSSKAASFRTLHEGPAFVIPNPWDAGSARVLEALGFKALATTSSGFAFTLGRRDGGATLDEVAGQIRVLDAATTLPVSADLENGYGPKPADAVRALERAAEAGAVGGSIEDFDPDGGIYELELAVERVA